MENVSIFFPINTIRDIPIGQNKIKNCSKVHHLLSEILLWWCVIGNQKDYLKLLSSNCFRASLQRGTQCSVLQTDTHTTKWIPNSNFSAKWKKWKSLKHSRVEICFQWKLFIPNCAHKRICFTLYHISIIQHHNPS